MRGWAKAPVSGLGGVVFAVLLVALVLSAPVMAQTGKGKGKAAVVAAAAPAVVKGDAQRGAVKSEDERCQECHGVDGHGFGQSASSEGRHPKLAGQSAAYIIKQLDNFRSGARKHDVMTMMARTVDPADIVDIAAYFASRPPMKGDGTGDSAAGRALYEKGDPARGVTACITCHGPGGKGLAGLGAESPLIGGQEWRYLEKQLLDWRSGERSNSRDGVMNTVIRPLTDQDIRALSDYLSGLP